MKGIVELSGEAGSGKTQLACQVALRCCEATGGCALIINTEGPFPASRLEQIASGIKDGDKLVDRVKIADLADSKALELYCTNALPGLVSRENLRLIVVDSMAAPLRGEMGGLGDAPERSRLLFSIAAQLLRLNAELGCGILVTNQVTDVMGGERSALGSALSFAASTGVRCIPRLQAALSAGRWVRPALGLSWDACASHRVLMVKENSGAGGLGASRSLFLLSSPAFPSASLSYGIKEAGILSCGVCSPIPC